MNTNEFSELLAEIETREKNEMKSYGVEVGKTVTFPNGQEATITSINYGGNYHTVSLSNKMTLTWKDIRRGLEKGKSTIK
jgi:putative aminopeptidase FrvX